MDIFDSSEFLLFLYLRFYHSSFHFQYQKSSLSGPRQSLVFMSSVSDIFCHALLSKLDVFDQPSQFSYPTPLLVFETELDDNAHQSTVTPLSSILTSTPAASPFPVLLSRPSLPHLLTLTLNPASLTALSLPSACLTAVSASISLLNPCTVLLSITSRSVGSVGQGEGNCGRNAIEPGSAVLVVVVVVVPVEEK